MQQSQHQMADGSGQPNHVQTFGAQQSPDLQLDRSQEEKELQDYHTQHVNQQDHVQVQGMGQLAYQSHGAVREQQVQPNQQRVVNISQQRSAPRSGQSRQILKQKAKLKHDNPELLHRSNESQNQQNQIDDQQMLSANMNFTQHMAQFENGNQANMTANLNDSSNVFGSIERLNHVQNSRAIVGVNLSHNDAMLARREFDPQPRVGPQKKIKVSTINAAGGTTKGNSSLNKKKESQQLRSENNRGAQTTVTHQGIVIVDQRSAFAPNLSSASSKNDQFVQQRQHQLLTGAGAKLQLIAARSAGQAPGPEGKKDTSRTKGNREASTQKRFKETQGANSLVLVDNSLQNEKQISTIVPTKKSKSQTNQNALAAGSQHQQSSNRRKVTGNHNNQKKQVHTNMRAQPQQMALQLQQQLENPMLIRNTQEDEHSLNQRRMVLQQMQEHALTDQTQLYISKFKPDGTSAYQQPPTTKSSTKGGTVRAAQPLDGRLNEFGCLISVGSAAQAKKQTHSQSQTKSQADHQASLDVSQQQEAATRQHIILSKGQINNMMVGNQNVSQTAKKGSAQQARVQSGHPIIKASKVSKRGNLQMATVVANNQQVLSQKMNIKQQLQNAQGNGIAFKILKPSVGKSSKSGQGRGQQNVNGALTNLMFNQTGKLISADVKTDPNANTNTKLKFNKTHGYQDNHLLLQHLKQTQQQNISASIAEALHVEAGGQDPSLVGQYEQTRALNATASDSLSRRGATGLSSEYQSKHQQLILGTDERLQLVQASGSATEAPGKAGRSLVSQQHKGLRQFPLSKQGTSRADAGNVEILCNSQEYIDPKAVLNINRQDYADPQVLTMGSTALENTGLIAPGPGTLFAQAHGPSSATNKVKKAFDFEIEAQQQMKINKREKRNLQGTSSTNQAQANNTTDSINLGYRKATSTNKKVNNLLKMQQQTGHNMVASSIASKKISMQKPKNFIKTQMNLTGPLPKHMLSPGPYTNKSKLKTKHSQYFDNSSEIENHIQPAQNQLQPQLHDFRSQQLARNFNSSQQFQQPLMQHQNGSNQPHQFQVQVHGIGQNGAPIPSAQHQITTQGGSTVININIDSNGWGQPPSIRQTSYQTQQQQQLMPNAQQDEVVLHDSSQMTNINVSSEAQRNQSGAEPTQSQVSYVGHQPLQPGSSNNAQTTVSRVPVAHPVKRQTSSKLRQNESVSSNKSRRHGQGSNNRRSSSSSHVQNQMQNNIQHQNASQYQQNQQNTHYVTATQAQQSNFGDLQAQHYDFQNAASSHANPHSNTQIISQNIAKINEKLLQQQHQQNLMIAEQKVTKDQMDQQNLSYRVDQLNNSKILDTQAFTANNNYQTHVIKGSDLNKIDLQNQKNLVQGNGQQKKNSTSVVKDSDSLIIGSSKGASGNARVSNMKLLNQTQLVPNAVFSCVRNELDMTHNSQGNPYTMQQMVAANGMGIAPAGASLQGKHGPLQVQMFQVIPKKIIKHGTSQAVGTPLNGKLSQKQMAFGAGGQHANPASFSSGGQTTNQLKQQVGARGGMVAQSSSSVPAGGQPSKLALKKGASQKWKKNPQDNIVQLQNVHQVYDSASQIGSARFQSANNRVANDEHQLNQQMIVNNLPASNHISKEQLVVYGAGTGEPHQQQMTQQEQEEQQVASLGNLQQSSQQLETSSQMQADYDQHVRNLENQIKQDQIRLRNELAQMTNEQNNMKKPQLTADDQMEGMQMDVDNEEITNNLDNQVLSMLDQQILIKQQSEDGSIDGVQYAQANQSLGAADLHNAVLSSGGTNSGLHQYNQIRQQAAIVSLENSQMHYMNSFNNSANGAHTSGSMSKNYKTHVSSSQKSRQYQVSQPFVGQSMANQSVSGVQVGIISVQNNRNTNHSGSVQRRQPSHDDPNKFHMIEGSGGQSIRQSSQLRVTQHQMANQNSAQRGPSINKGATSNTKGKGNNNRSAAISFKGSNMSNRSRSKAGRGSKFNQRVSNTKYNFEDINIDIEARHQLLMDSSLGLAAAVQSFGTKKSVTTKNQNLTNKLQTQNVQSLLRNAKAEMLYDGTDLDQIYVGGEDVTIRNNKKKRINLNGSQNLALGPQINNFGFQQQRLNIKFGISPKNHAKKLELPSHASMMQYNMIAANANAKSTSNNTANIQLSDYRTSNQALSQTSQQQPIQIQRSSLKQPSAQAIDSKANRKILQQYSTNQQQVNNNLNQIQVLQNSSEVIDHVLKSGPNQGTHVYSSDPTIKQMNDGAYGSVVGQVASGPQNHGLTISTVMPVGSTTQTNTGGLSATTSAAPTSIQHAGPNQQYNSVILNSTSSASQANAKSAGTNNTFGLGQINIRNKIIKPPVPLQAHQQNAQNMNSNNIQGISNIQQAIPEQQNIQRNLSQEEACNIQMINSKSTVSAASQAGQETLNDAGRQFEDADMDMDNVVLVDDQQDYSVGQELDEEGEQRGETAEDLIDYDDSLQVAYVNQITNNNHMKLVHEGVAPQSHAFSLAQDLSMIGSGNAGPTTMHSLQHVNLTDMTDEGLEEAQQMQANQIVQYSKPAGLNAPELNAQQQLQHQEQTLSQQQQQKLMERDSQAIFKSQEEAMQEQQKKQESDQPDLPLSGAKVLKHYLKRPGLTEYEKSEILDYKACYFLGIGAEKIKGSKQHQYNSGYDDERGDYNVVLKDQIAYRFEVVDFLGKGSFGQALKCVDHKTSEIVAIKIIRNKKKFQHQAGVELKILLHLKENDPEDTNNIIRIKDYCMFRKHLIISFELFSINLYEFIRNNNFEGVSLSLIRRFAIQILQALKYLREESLIHCDLKPENILLKSPDKSGIKVIDFGSSCFSNERIYTYIQSRFYRAPEIILGIPYTTAIDMWSFGCILTELFTGVPLFPGESEQEQLSLIMEVIGLPSQDILAQASRKTVFFDEETNEPYLSRDSQGNFRVPSSKPLDEILMCQSDSFHDFINKCLEWDPEKRITPFDALMHEWIIEGLPDQVLIHHKKMLGIYESETEGANTALNNQSHSMLDTSVQDADNIANVSGLNRNGRTGSHSNQLSSINSQLQSQLHFSRDQSQAPNSRPSQPISDQIQQRVGQIVGSEFEEKASELSGNVNRTDASISAPNQHQMMQMNHESMGRIPDQQQIDFYGDGQEHHVSGERVDSFEGERYESILSPGLTSNQMANMSTQQQDFSQVQNQHFDQMALPTDISKNLLQGQDQFEMDLLKNGYQIAANADNGGQKMQEPNRSGAKQENFIKTGKQNFKEINKKLEIQLGLDKKQSKPFGHQVYHTNKSDMADDEPVHDEFIAMEMQAAIGNTNINRLIGQDIRGIPQIPPTSGSNLSGYDMKVPKRFKKNPLLGGMLLGDMNEKNQTGNIMEILQQVNKKSKSTKHQNILLPGSGLHYNYGLGSGTVGPDPSKADGQRGAKDPGQRTESQPHSEAVAPMPSQQYGNCFTTKLQLNQTHQGAVNPQNINLGKAKRSSFLNKREGSQI